MGERIFALRVATYDWFERRPRLIRFLAFVVCWLGFFAIFNWWFEEEASPTIGNVVVVLVFAVIHGFSNHHLPVRAVPKPPAMSELEYRAQKVARWLLAVPLALGLSGALDASLEDGGGLWSKPQLTAFVPLIWLSAAYIPLWQPSRWRSPEEKHLPPFPTTLRHPKAG